MRRLVFAALAVLLGLSVIEGLASLAIGTYYLAQARPQKPPPDWQFDSHLGWVDRANAYVPDFWGPGVYVRTNERGFRSNQRTDLTTPEGKHRIVCSGDSFTFGHSVSNDDTWVNLLQLKDERLETVDLGESGYGVDQSYLRYERDGAALEQDVHCLALITDDLRRMAREEYDGFVKPKLTLRAGRLIIENEPVTQAPWYASLVARRFAIEHLGAGRIIGWTIRHVRAEMATDEQSAIGPLALRIFERLQQLSRENQSVLVVVYLPIASDHYTGDSDAWRAFLAEELGKRHIAFVDLVPEFRRWAYESVVEMFVGAKESGSLAVRGHYTKEGNRAIADALYERLMALPEVSMKINSEPTIPSRALRLAQKEIPLPAPIFH